MSRNGAGSYALPTGNPTSDGTTITASLWNTTFSDVATALSQSLSQDGQTPITGNQPMSSFKHTGVGAATVRTEYATFGQVQDSTAQWLTAVAGTDTITASASTPALAAYVAGQTFRFVATGSNASTAVTLNINALGAKAVTKNGSTALAVGDLVGGIVYVLVYDGTRFQLTGPVTSVSGTLTSAQVTTALGYTPPQPVNGVGASGSWPINITGNAAGSSTSCSGNAGSASLINVASGVPNSMSVPFNNGTWQFRMGTVGSSPSGTAVSFTPAFPSTCAGVIVCPQVGGSTDGIVGDYYNPSAAGFNVVLGQPGVGVATRAFSYFAWGY